MVDDLLVKMDKTSTGIENETKQVVQILKKESTRGNNFFFIKMLMLNYNYLYLFIICRTLGNNYPFINCQCAGCIVVKSGQNIQS